MRQGEEPYLNCRSLTSHLDLFTSVRAPNESHIDLRQSVLSTCAYHSVITKPIAMAMTMEDFTGPDRWTMKDDGWSDEHIEYLQNLDSSGSSRPQPYTRSIPD